MSEYNVGDKIRLQFEGEVVYVGPDRTEVATTRGDVRSFKSSAVRQHVTVLERRKPKVGDKVETRKDFAALPVGTVAKRNYTQAVSVRVPGGFTNINDSDEGYTHPVHDNYGSCGFDGTVAYLPD